MQRPKPRGFTMIEMMIVVAIMGVMMVLAVAAYRRAAPRATLHSVSAEIESLVHSARQHAMAHGVPVAVMVFPQYQPKSLKWTGRIVVIQDASDPASSILNGEAPLHLGNYRPDPNAADAFQLEAPAGGKVVTYLDLPPNIVFGPDDGAGAATRPPYPLMGIKVDVACSFCLDDGDRRGAVVFDRTGRPTFWNVVSGEPKQLDPAVDFRPDLQFGASFTIQSLDLTTQGARDTSTLLITSPQGLLRTILHG